MRLLLALLLTLGAAAGHAQTDRIAGLRVSGSDYYALEDLTLALGYSTTAGTGSVTVRSQRGVLTLFEGSPDALWQAAGAREPEQRSSFGPVVVVAGRWYLPADLLETLGVEVVEGGIALPDGRRLPVAFPPPAVLAASGAAEVVDLGSGVPGLRFYALDADGGETVSLLLVDVGLLALVFPEQRRELDGFVAGVGRDKPLYFLVTALTESAWESTLEFSQDERRLEVRHPFRVRILEGDAERVGPDRPVAGLVLLPDAFNLRRPLTVHWGELSATVTFRR